MTTDETSSTTRRAIIRTGVAAGAGIGAAAVVATPASAAAGDPVLAGKANDAGTAETVLVGGSSANPTLELSGYSPQLLLTPTPVAAIPEDLPTGSLATTSSADLIIGGRGGRKAYVNTSSWANRTVAIPPVRLLDTREMASYSANVTYGAADVVSGKLQAGKLLQLTVAKVPTAANSRPIAAYVNITVANTVSAGVLTAYSAALNSKPATSSLNWWGPNQVLSNLVEVQVSTYQNTYRFNIHVNAATSVIVDLSGLILAEPAR